MALKITFDDKVTKNVSTDEENKKITANNVNEIKQVVNSNADEMSEIIEGENNRFIYHDVKIYNGRSKTFKLEPLKNYLLVVTQYGQGNVSSNATRLAIITTGENTDKQSRVNNIFSDVSELCTIEFMDGLTAKITANTNKWMIISLTKL